MTTALARATKNPNIGLVWQNNNSTRFFVHFFAVTARLRRENIPYFTFWGGREHRTMTFFFFSWTSKSFKTQATIKTVVWQRRLKHVKRKYPSGPFNNRLLDTVLFTFILATFWERWSTHQHSRTKPLQLTNCNFSKWRTGIYVLLKIRSAGC